MDRELGAAKLQLLKDQQEHGSKLIRLQTHKVGWWCVFGALLGGVWFLLGLMSMTSRGLGVVAAASAIDCRSPEALNVALALSAPTSHQFGALMSSSQWVVGCNRGIA